jgi:hypothetical protein
MLVSRPAAVTRPSGPCLQFGEACQVHDMYVWCVRTSVTGKLGSIWVRGHSLLQFETLTSGAAATEIARRLGNTIIWRRPVGEPSLHMPPSDRCHAPLADVCLHHLITSGSIDLTVLLRSPNLGSPHLLLEMSGSGGSFTSPDLQR